jgi:chromate transporter
MATVSWKLARSAVVDWVTAALALTAVVVLLSTRLNSAWLVAGGAAAGGLGALLR